MTVEQQNSLDLLQKELVKLNVNFAQETLQYPCFSVVNEHWSRAAEAFNACNARFSGVWADQNSMNMHCYALFWLNNQYCMLTTVITDSPYQLPSQASVYPNSNRMERHIRDLLGIEFIDSPDARRWTRHLAWKNKEFPLNEQFPVKRETQRMTSGDNRYAFFQTQGVGVSEIPVGPIHAGIIEPGHFRFQIMGETVLNLEQRLGYTHKGIEKIAVGKTPEQLLKLAARVSGDSAVTHAWCAAMAIENASGIVVPERALFLRAILLERERIANHIGDIGAVCNDVGFAFAHQQTARIRELWLRTQLMLFGHRLLMDTITIGGVAIDLNNEQIQSLLTELDATEKDFNEVIDIIQDYPSLEDRLATTGYLPEVSAKALGCLGYVGRASGLNFDVRRDAPYAPYEQFKIEQISFKNGDVLSRVQVRVEEVRSSFKLLSKLLHKIELMKPELQQKNSPETVKPNTQALGIVAGWRGETFAFVRLDEQGKVARYFPRDASWLNWVALEALIDNNIVADFPVCNKSVNGSYSGVDL